MGRGAHVKLKHVHRFKDRHGRARAYLRVPGKPSVALPGDVGSPEFMAAYHNACADLSVSTGSTGTAKPYSMNDLALRYFQSTAFKGKSDRTRYVERQQIDRFLKAHGDKGARTVKAVHLDAIFAAMADRPAAAMDLRKRLRLVFRHAIKLGWRDDNPVDATDTFTLGKHHTWTEDEIAAFHAAWPHGTTQRAAFDLLLFTGQRSGDVRQMTWADLAGGRVRVVAQDKTGQAVSVRQHSELSATLAKHQRAHVVVIVSERGAPFSEGGFGNWMAKAIAKAGLPERCVPHGLRKAAARRLAEAGATDREIMSITGHRTVKEVTRYTDAADRARMADAGMEKVEKVNTRLQTARKPEDNSQ